MTDSLSLPTLPRAVDPNASPTRTDGSCVAGGADAPAPFPASPLERRAAGALRAIERDSLARVGRAAEIAAARAAFDAGRFAEAEDRAEFVMAWIEKMEQL